MRKTLYCLATAVLALSLTRCATDERPGNDPPSTQKAVVLNPGTEAAPPPANPGEPASPDAPKQNQGVAVRSASAPKDYTRSASVGRSAALRPAGRETEAASVNPRGESMASLDNTSFFNTIEESAAVRGQADNATPTTWTKTPLVEDRGGHSSGGGRSAPAPPFSPATRARSLAGST